MRVAQGLIAATLLSMVAGLPACRKDEGPTKAEKAAAKRARDAGLLALRYPVSGGTQPASMSVTYDGAGDRTIMTLTLTGLRVGGRSAASVKAAALHLTSTHQGRTRAADDPEGAIDAALIVQSAGAGVLAFSGPPGSIIIDGAETPLRAPSGVGAYSSVKGVGGHEEAVRFRIPTEAVVGAASGSSVSLRLATVTAEVSGQHLAEWREFAARLKPGA